MDTDNFQYRSVNFCLWPCDSFLCSLMTPHSFTELIKVTESRPSNLLGLVENIETAITSLKK